MGSQVENPRTNQLDIKELDDEGFVAIVELSCGSNDGRSDRQEIDLDPDAVQVDLFLPPVPPRPRRHEPQPRFAVQTLDLDDDRPPVPVRVPLLGSHSPPTAEWRPIIQPRCRTDANLAGVHGNRRPSPSRSRPALSGFSGSEVGIVPTTAQKPLLHSRIILDRGRPTTIIEPESARTLSSESPVVQLSLWPTRSSPALSLGLGSANPQKCSNEYVEGPTLGSSAVPLEHRELPSSGSRRGRELVLPAAVGRVEAKTLGQRTTDVKRKGVCKDQIVCSRCGRCRCRSCAERPELPLPRRWIGKCECGLESAVDCCTCMCCARALLYHCVPTEEADCSDEPCAGRDRPHCCARFAVLGLLSVCLPCLCCYWPMRGLVRACSSCYNGCGRASGCRCRRDLPSGAKGLLMESESSSF